MVRGHACRQTGVQRRPFHIRQMALTCFSGHLVHMIHGLHQIREPVQDIGSYHLRNAHRVLPLHSLFDNLRIKMPAAGLQIRRKGHMRRNHKIKLQIRRFRFLQDRLDPFQTCHHPDLMKVRHDRSGTVLQYQLRKGTDRKACTLRVNVPVYKSGCNIIAARVDHLCTLADGIIHVADRRDPISADGYAAFINFLRIYIDQFPVFYHNIRRSLSACCCQ